MIGSNFCDIAVSEKDGNVVFMAALDNLVKGIVGQVIENMNLALGFGAITGLRFASWYPV